MQERMIADLKDVKQKILKLRKHNLDPRSDAAKCFTKYGKAIQDMAETILEVKKDDDDEIPSYIQEGFDSASQREWFHSREVLDYCRQIDETIAEVTKVAPPPEEEVTKVPSPPREASRQAKKKTKQDAPKFNLLDFTQEGKYL